MAIVINHPTSVFEYLVEFHNFLPGPVRYLIYVAFGGMVLIAILRGIGR